MFSAFSILAGMQASLRDIVYLQPYCYLLHEFNNNSITAAEFETLFLAVRRTDQYQFPDNISHCLRVLFSAVDDYAPPELYDENDPYDITEAELRQKTIDILKEISMIIY